MSSSKRLRVENGEPFQSPPKCEAPVINELDPSRCSDDTTFDQSNSTRCSHRHDVKALLLKEANYDIDNPSNIKRREDYLSWESYFMAIAYLSAQRSKHPRTQSGACIVDEEKRIIGIGYNGFPRGCSDDCLPWASSTDIENILHTHHPYTCHAEVNAILNKSSTDVKGSTMYVPELPCNECAKLIIQSGISEVVYLRNQKSDESSRASRIMFGMAGVKLRQYSDETTIDPLDFSIYGSNHTGGDDGKKAQQERDKYRTLLQTEASYDVDRPTVSKRCNYLSWDDYFTCVAYLSARRSKDPNTQVGAVIVDENKCIIAIGYNGFPRGCSDEYLPWARSGDSELHKKYAFVTHAEVNAVLNKGSKDVKGATIYVALFPCNECAKIIVQSGIKEVVYLSDVYHDTDSCRASRIMFSMAGVKTRKYIPSKKVVTINLD
jgi:dCMP deaminase